MWSTRAIGVRYPVSLLHQQQKRFAGHNKWSKIRHKKGARDVSKAKEFAKATRAIRAASRACSADMSNLHLQSVVARAKAIQVPKDKIMDAIEGSSKANEEALMSVRYDCRIPTPCGKVAFIIMALTNNKNRTFTNIRTFVAKAGGEMLNTGANDWLFDHVGVALVHKKRALPSDHSLVDSNDSLQLSDPVLLSDKEQDKMLEDFLEAGATDVDFGQDSDEHLMIECLPNQLHTLITKIRPQYIITEFETRYMAKTDSTILLDDTSSDDLSKFIEKLDDDDDVSALYHIATLTSEEV